MERITEVTSKMLSRVKYDDETHVLTVTFNNGGTYDFAGVSPEAHEALINAESVGKHFLAHIKPQYNGVKQAPPVEESAIAS